jgi:hypothetical protein
VTGPEAPHLKPAEAPDPAAEPAPGNGEGTAGVRTGEPEERPSNRRWVVALAVALAVALVLLLGQVRKSNSLADRIEALEIELTAAQDRLFAYDRHLEAVREGVGGVAARVEALQRLVDAGPGAPADELGAAAPADEPTPTPAGE